MDCKICSTAADKVFTGIILDKYEIDYFRCPECRFMQTEDPYWLTEAYAEAITHSDVGLLNRNIELAKMTPLLILIYFSDKIQNVGLEYANPVVKILVKTLNLKKQYFYKKLNKILEYEFDAGKKYIDYGGGYGIYVRLMRDSGFNFYWHDEYCENLFAKEFVGDLNREYDMLTAFEVFEHLPDPLNELEKMLKISGNVLFTTKLLPDDETPGLNDWWYYGTEHGQHISFFSRKTLEHIAKKYSKNYCQLKGSLHLFSNRRIDKKKINFVLKNHEYYSGMKRFKNMKKSLQHTNL